MYWQSIGKARAEQSWLWPDLVSMSPCASRTPRISPFLTPEHWLEPSLRRGPPNGARVAWAPLRGRGRLWMGVAGWDDHLMSANATLQTSAPGCEDLLEAVNLEKQEMGTESYGQTSFLLSRNKWQDCSPPNQGIAGIITISSLRSRQRKYQSFLSSGLWAEVLGLEWLGWCKLVGHEHDREALLPLTVSAGNGSYWCIKSQPADPDLIILGHLKISSGQPLVATLGRCLLCTQLCSPSTRLGRLCSPVARYLHLLAMASKIHFWFLVTGDSESGRQVAPLWLFLAGCQMWKTLMRARCLPSKTKLGCLVVTSPPH